MLEVEGKNWKNPVLLGRGGFSEVYRVTDMGTGEFGVCKVSEGMEMAKREAALLQRVVHPLFPEYKGQFVEGDRHYLFMEYISGMHLRKYVKKRGRLSQRRGVQIAMELAEGLLYLHEQSDPVIFRDIKPENVMIQQDGRVRLLDLGCACTLGKQSGNLAGSRGYAAPEQFMTGGMVGMESDVYALGRLLYFMLTGREELDGKYPRRISPGLKRLIAQAVKAEQKQRIPDMRSFLLQVAVYNGKKPFKCMLGDIKALLSKRERNIFFYEKNITKGL